MDRKLKDANIVVLICVEHFHGIRNQLTILLSYSGLQPFMSKNGWYFVKQYLKKIAFLSVAGRFPHGLNLSSPPPHP